MAEIDNASPVLVERPRQRVNQARSKLTASAALRQIAEALTVFKASPTTSAA